MSWLDELLPASFAGVAFYVEEGGSGQCGRRTQLSNTPFADHFALEDLGQLNAPFTLRAFLIDDANAEALHSRHSQLVAALNSGIGVLVHPRLGRMRVLPGACNYTFNGSRIRYTLQFMPPEQAPEREQAETSTQVDAQCNAAASAVNTQAAHAIDTSQPGLLSTAVADVQSALTTLQVANGAVDAALAPVAELALTVSQVSDELTDLMAAPLDVFNQVRNVYQQMLAAADDIDTVLQRYRDFKPQLDVPTTTSTPTQQRRATNARAIDTALKAAAVIETLRLVSQRSAELNVTDNTRSPFDNYSHAVALRDELLAEVDDLLPYVVADAYEALLGLRAVFYQHIDAHGMRLPRVAHLQFGVALPAWVIAHDVYGDALQMDDLVRRNQVSDPAYIPAHTPLEILRNA